ncbi:SpoIIE family protein phosphatase [Flammeovirga yaeyamensis]|uniref:SpoIIE family protein phosphatase n=1 Tax=Flammeovirga yaeyamensis TaxID=367791 RepID=A0AAX1N5R4_9BACT|nr:SpoIIE family protein phosphatase [Flammeovirga yaeyamensis]MBB3697482.1 serine phosphatase RsbU (regulator of sigma subunit) [Flammeovirga yaeyamensis]NMF36176.1 SpoIIE family protein phosphatase [Flammeovirga yaeyamensis]QWG02909.1 SpoIIE family protein phosphatase [Flammeovirga yaeyamensis]
MQNIDYNNFTNEQIRKIRFASPYFFGFYLLIISYFVVADYTMFKEIQPLNFTAMRVPSILFSFLIIGLRFYPKYKNSTSKNWQYLYTIGITSIIYGLFGITYLAYGHKSFDSGLYIISAVTLSVLLYSVIPPIVMISIVLGGLIPFCYLLEYNYNLLVVSPLINNFIVINITILLITIIKYRIEHRAFIQRQMLISERNKNKELYQVSLLQNKELSTKNKQIEKQKDLLSSQYYEIKESINYASNIQKTFLPHFEVNNISRVENLFIFNKPKQQVSGDFYWKGFAMGQYQIIVCGDSTGHGVPGALMSMLGVSLLDKIVNQKNIHNPKQIIERLHDELSNLNYDKDHLYSRDGMAISILRIPLDPNDNTITFAGAKSPILIVDKEDEYFIKGGRYYIGNFFGVENKCENYTIEIKKGMMVYLYSDGYEDQFGGKYNKKYKSIRFRTLLSNIANKDCKTQQLMLEEEFKQWKEASSVETSFQIDDVLVMGLRF